MTTLECQSSASHLKGHCFYLNPGRIQKMQVRLRLQLTINDVTPVPAKVKPAFTICVYNQILKTFSVVIDSICSNNVNKIYCILHMCACVCEVPSSRQVWFVMQQNDTQSHAVFFFKCRSNREQM
ncbi:hypothetical protein fugu_012529 [Takifugu bimaculatus]|uniref:Uncharacterized protein n=1 Tax=Takifugu bimaculatus TaxID=433685 RepID=A0A4Z2C5M4_9TELE|nr:hypothetical protein fugu_012529 [Takifugu bimaculatus]